MDTFGDRLKHEREDRGLTIQAVSEILRVDPDHLQALERNDFDALPDEAAMMDCLHGYAGCLEVDADLMIEDYAQERDEYLRGLETAVMEQVAETAPAAIPTEAEREPRFSPWLIALVVVAIALLAWWMLSRDGTAPTSETASAAVPVEPEQLSSKSPTEVAPKPEERATTAPVEPEPLSSRTPAEVVPTPVDVAATPTRADASPTVAEAPPAPADVTPTPADVTPTPADPPTSRSAPTSPAPSSLSITDYGVGTGVENLRLVGRSDRFEEGSRVWFWTHVQGGTIGDRIDHVWLMEGEEVGRRSLTIGGPSWRTSSAKTIVGGVGSEWVVEVRDAAGRVLARSEFISSP